MATSYLHYAPALGYRGSVFNLVYADNAASLKIWDTLGFQRVGLIPGAGKRTRTIGAVPSGGGQGDVQREEVYYVDAYVIFKSFV
jgi:ribosomal protein S18 acetylase RimI-like enzyme